MMFYMIRDRESGKLMPEYKSGKGYSYWLYDDQIENQKKTPRLLDSEAQADKVIVEWAKGIFIWEDVKHNPNNMFEAYLHDPKRVMKPIGRRKDMLEVVPIEIEEWK